MSGPDPPFDAEAELAKVVGGVRPSDLVEGSIEHEFDTNSSKLETELNDAIKAGDLDLAQEKKDELSRAHLDDCGAVLQANLRFYKAFSKKDYEEMSDLWVRDASVTCIHPGHAPLVGASAVLKSWKKMFGSDDTSFRRNGMEPSNVRLSVRGATATVTCDENVYTRRFVRGRKRRTELVNRLTATNIFRKVGGRWQMSHHHASWHADTDAAKAALAGRGGLGKKSSNRERDSGRNDDEGPSSVEGVLGIPGHEGLSGKGYGEKSEKKEKKSSLEGLEGLEGLQGLGGLEGLGGGKVEGSDKPIRRVFMGSLSDLLNGGLSDILSNTSPASEEDEADIDSILGKGDSGDDSEEGPTIINLNFDDEDESEIEGIGEEDDGDMVVRFMKSEEGNVAHIVSSSSSDKDKKDVNSVSEITVSESSSSPDDDDGSASGSPPKDALRQNCIAALRRLADQGAISPKQKRVLLTDIIVCSARGEFSLVEVAYELLCGEEATSAVVPVVPQVVKEASEEAEDDGVRAAEMAAEIEANNARNIAEEEFADQCRVFASSLPESPAPRPYSH